MKPTIFFAMLSSFRVHAPLQILQRLPGVDTSEPIPDGNGVKTDVRSGFLDLTEVELHRSGTAENRDGNAKLAFLVVHVFHVAVEIGERTILDPHHFANFEK